VAIDTLLSTGDRLTGIAAALSAWLPGAPPVYVDQPLGNGPTPFVVITGQLAPDRVGLSGAWSRADLYLHAWSVHDSPAQARALGDLVRTWVLTLMATPGQADVAPGDEWRADDPGGVQQGHESWTVTLVRT
jgi:hypothetical protein